MPRLFIALATVLAVALPLARGQEPRYVPIPFQGDFEALFKKRLNDAKLDPTRQLLEEIRKNSAKYNLDPKVLEQLNLDNSGLQKQLQGMLDKYKQSGQITDQDKKIFEKIIAEQNRLPKGTGQTKALPKNDGPTPKAGPPLKNQAKLPQANPELLDRWLRDWVDHAENSNVGNWLRDSPTFQKGLKDLKTLGNLEDAKSIWGPSNLPEHLRLTEKLNLNLGEGLLSKFQNISLPDIPRVQLPQVNLGNWSLPAVRLPNLGSPGNANFGNILLWGLILVACIVLCWQLVRKHSDKAPSSPTSFVLGPWPVDPARIVTRGQLVQAFDYLALLLLGIEVRSWNHRAVARALAHASQQAEYAQELARLYELARYTTGDEQLTPEDQSAARRNLCLLAGVPLS